LDAFTAAHRRSRRPALIWFRLMHNAFAAVLALGLMALIGVLIASFYFLDRLIRYQHAHHRDAWERDGCPNTPSFRPLGTTWFRSGLAFQRCALGWPLYTPSWIRADAAAKALHSRLRWCVLIWNAGFITWVLFFMLYLRATQSI
jgi:hypothetical protein